MTSSPPSSGRGTPSREAEAHDRSLGPPRHNVQLEVCTTLDRRPAIVIDFRYHLVSIISVFLALAVGIVLGSGPLKEAIGDTINSEVDGLRSDKDKLRSDLDAMTAHARNSDSYIDAASIDLLGDQLDKKSVAIVVLPGVDSALVDAAKKRVEQAGGTVAVTMTVLDKWTTTEDRTFRTTLSSSLVADMKPATPANAGMEAELAAALAGSLSQTDSGSKTLNEGATTMLSLLQSSNLVKVDATPKSAVDGAILLTPTAPTDAEIKADSITDEQLQATLKAYVAIASALQERVGAAVTTGPALESADTVAAIRGDEDLRSKLTTVDSFDLVSGQVSAPMALAQSIANASGQYGFRSGADNVVPARIEPVVPTATPTTEPPAPPAEGQTTDQPPADGGTGG